MTDLSPQAQAIIDAFDFEYYQKATTRQVTLAAVLRAVAKQSTVADTRVGVTEKVVLVDDILKIATELEQW